MTRPMTVDGPTRTRPRWTPETMEREHLLKGPIPLDPTAFTADAFGRRVVLSGAYVGRTYAERDAGTGFGPVAAGDEERCLIAFTVRDATVEPYGTGFMSGYQVWENFLPGFSGLDPAVKALLRADYRCGVGAD